MDRSEGFAPLSSSDSEVLVLGSLPGRHSIAAQQYYAHPRNAFWKIIEDTYGVRGQYTDRCHALVGEGVALWDVLQASVRPGSLDADIDLKTARANDFNGFMQTHEKIEAIVFNGKKAEALFRRLVLPRSFLTLRMQTLPSTSPAYAAMPYERKLSAWRAALPLRQCETRDKTI